MWRTATERDDMDIVAMSSQLYAEDPAPMAVPEAHTRRTLSMLRSEPTRGRAVVLELDGVVSGYAFLISFLSNELGGEVIVIDELYIRPPHRGQGLGTALLTELAGESELWPGKAVALELEATPANIRAKSLYGRIGFKPVKNARLRLLKCERGHKSG